MSGKETCQGELSAVVHCKNDDSHVLIPESDIICALDHVQEGEEVQFYFPGYKKPWDGTVKKVGYDYHELSRVMSDLNSKIKPKRELSFHVDQPRRAVTNQRALKNTKATNPNPKSGKRKLAIAASSVSKISKTGTKNKRDVPDESDQESTPEEPTKQNVDSKPQKDSDSDSGSSLDEFQMKALAKLVQKKKFTDFKELSEIIKNNNNRSATPTSSSALENPFDWDVSNDYIFEMTKGTDSDPKKNYERKEEGELRKNEEKDCVLSGENERRKEDKEKKRETNEKCSNGKTDKEEKRETKQKSSNDKRDKGEKRETKEKSSNGKRDNDSGKEDKKEKEREEEQVTEDEGTSSSSENDSADEASRKKRTRIYMKKIKKERRAVTDIVYKGNFYRFSGTETKPKVEQLGTTDIWVSVSVLNAIQRKWRSGTAIARALTRHVFLL